MQQQFNQVNKAELGSVALPGIVRHGAGGPENFQMGTMPQAQQQVTSGQMHRGHMPPLVRESVTAASLHCVGEGGVPGLCGLLSGSVCHESRGSPAAPGLALPPGCGLVVASWSSCTECPWGWVGLLWPKGAGLR